MAKIAVLQTSSGSDVAQNLAQAEGMIRAAHQEGAQLVAMPEVVDFRDEGAESYQRYAQPQEAHRAADFFAALARELKLWILAGSLTVRDPSGKLANRSFLFDADGKVAANYDKIHLFDTGVVGDKASTESNIYVPGDRAVVVDTPVGRLGLSICYDLRFPHLFRDLAKAGAQILAVPSSFLPITGAAHWHVLLRARAIETGCYVIAPGQCGSYRAEHGSYGHSLIVDPWGELLADAGEEAGYVVADIDLGHLASVRDRIRSLSHDRPYTLPAKAGIHSSVPNGDRSEAQTSQPRLAGSAFPPSQE
jgi:deaminated glutathione amidase